MSQRRGIKDSWVMPKGYYCDPDLPGCPCPPSLDEKEQPLGPPLGAQKVEETIHRKILVLVHRVGGGIFYLDFKFVRCMTYVYATRLIRAIRKSCLEDEGCSKVRVVFRNLSRILEIELDMALRGSGLVMFKELCIMDRIEWQMLGASLDKVFKDTACQMIKIGSTTAKELASSYNLPQTTAFNRLSKLFNVGLLTRNEEKVGRNMEFRYHFILPNESFQEKPEKIEI